ncbi:MAG: hypothetical protein QF659_10795, partial [Dehalococcoidia bacterium]|nr:hypothetical protein [Dehalococcoidia bacterium]
MTAFISVGNNRLDHDGLVFHRDTVDQQPEELLALFEWHVLQALCHSVAKSLEVLKCALSVLLLRCPPVQLTRGSLQL